MAPPNSTESWRHHFRRGISDVLFIIVIVLSFLLLLILFGYHNTDPGWSTSGAVQEDTKHFLGIIGAYIADALFSALGYAAYLLPLGLSAISWQGLRRSELDAELMAWKGLALVIAMIALCGVLSLHATTPINSLAVTGGGLAGQKITIELLRIWPIQLVMGIYTLLFFIGITLLLETNWLGVLESLAVAQNRRTDAAAYRQRRPIPAPPCRSRRRRWRRYPGANKTCRSPARPRPCRRGQIPRTTRTTCRKKSSATTTHPDLPETAANYSRRRPAAIPRALTTCSG